MRVLRIGGQSLGVSAAHEAEWAVLASEAVRAAQAGETPVPVVRFRTDTGAFGSLPVSERVPVSFVDEDNPVGFLGSVTLLGPATGPPRHHTAQ
jgi:hypothetical protein